MAGEALSKNTLPFLQKEKELSQRGHFKILYFVKINCAAGLYLLSITIGTLSFSCLVKTTGSGKTGAGERVTMVPVYSAE